MKSQIGYSTAAYAILSLAAGVAFMLPEQLSIPTAMGYSSFQADVVYLTGVVYDFRRDHPDFGAQTTADNGHHAGNVGLTLTGRMRPQLRGGGFRVGSQWTDRDLHHIAPHLYMRSTPVELVTAPTITNSPEVDTYSVEIGPYGGTNVGTAPGFETGVPMPALTEPTGLPPLGPDMDYSGVGRTTLAGDYHCSVFRVRDRHEILIDGDVRILCDDLFLIRDLGTVLGFKPGSSLTLYVRGDVLLRDGAVINADTANPQSFVIYNLGIEPISITDDATVSAVIVSPDAPLNIADGAEFYGNVTAESLNIVNFSGFHHNGVIARDACGVLFNDTAGSTATAGTGGIDSAVTFNQWFESVLGTNLSTSHTIALTRGGDGIFEYSDDAFFPIDGRLFGNEGEAHNHNFTYMIQGEFTYRACQVQFMELRGADDFWFFVNDQLVLDLGGIRPNMPQYFAMDRFPDLVDGENYSFRLFYAQRQNLQAGFHIRTNLVEIEASSSVSTSPEFD